MGRRAKKQKYHYPTPFTFPSHSPLAFLKDRHEKNKNGKHFWHKRWFKISVIVLLAVAVVYFRERQFSATLLIVRIFDGILDVMADSAMHDG